MKTIVALVVLLAVANAGFMQKYPIQYGGKRSIMNIMMEVENKIKSRSPLDTIKGVLDGFRGAVADEQNTHDQVYGAQKTECDSEISYRSNEVQDATNTLKSANGILKTANILKGKAESTLAATDDILTTVSNHIGLINDARKGDTQTYNRGAVVFNDAINAIDDSIDLVAEFKNGGSSFVQVAEITTKFLQHSTALRMTKLYIAPMAALAQLTQEEDNAGSVERLGQLLVTLRENVEEAWQAYGEKNAQALGEFTLQKDLYVASSGRLETSKTHLANKIENLIGTISVQTAVQQAASNKKQRNQILLEDATDLCHSFDVEYATTTTGRRQELVLVAELERLAERRAAETA